MNFLNFGGFLGASLARMRRSLVEYVILNVISPRNYYRD